jgi:hypothetical protein
MKKLIALFCLLACVPAARAAEKTQKTQQPDAWILRDIVHYRAKTWTYQRTMGVRRTPYTDRAERRRSLPYRLWVRKLWLRRAVRARRQFLNGPHHAHQWLCIHRYEAPWKDRGDPYWGGLQMDRSFMQKYAAHLLRRKGTADRWTPLEQMWVAEKAYRSGRGFYPWPNTARSCGLL